MIDLVFVLLFSIAGVFVGVISGLLPGLHVNSISLILLSASGGIVALCSPLVGFGFSEQLILVLICCFILSVSISHSYHDNLPTIFLGAPEEETALSVLPTHGLLLRGRGYDAVVLSALGGLGAIAACFLLLYVIRFLIGPPLLLYTMIQGVMAWVLIGFVVLMIATDKGSARRGSVSGTKAYEISMALAVFVFILSGVFGLVINLVPVWSLVGLPSTVLFPALSGLFGAPTLFLSLRSTPVIPQQTIEPLILTKKEKKSTIFSVLAGSCAGILVSILPGVTSSTGTLLAMNTRKESDYRQTIVTLSAVNTASAFIVVVVLFLILKARSGVTLVISELISIEQWTFLMLPTTLTYFLIALLVSGVVSYFLVLKIGRLFAIWFPKLSYQKLVAGTFAFVVFLVVLFTGVIGVLVFFVAMCIGLLPVLYGVRRSHCMGVLLVPVILYFLPSLE